MLEVLQQLLEVGDLDTMQMVAGTIGILIFGGVIGLYLSNYYIIIRRFYSNLYGREGYLTWTLPASPHAIILSKFVGALVASLYCLFLLFLSGFITIIVMGAVIGQDLSPVFGIIAEAFSHSIAYLDYRLVDFYHSFRDLPILCIDRTWPTLPKSSWI